MKFFFTILMLLTISFAQAQERILQQALDSNNFFKLRDELVKRKNTLDSSAWLYYNSFVDNAFNRNDAAIQKARSFFAISSAQWTPQHILRIEEMLLDAFVKTYRYKDAAAISEVILTKYPPEAIEGFSNAKKIWEALAGVPPQQAIFKAGTDIPIERNVIGLWEIPVGFAGREEKFIFDTGANLSTISESYADKLKLKRIPVSINVSSGQGKKIKSELGVADSLVIGNIVFTNVIFLVMPDQQLDFPQGNFRINGIIGFPVISAMKEIRITKEGRLTIPQKASNRSFQNLALSGLTPLLQTRADKDTIVFQFDTGAAFTHLFSNYLDEHRDEILDNSQAEKIKMMSAGGGKNMKVYEIRQLKLNIADDIVKLNNVKVYTKAVHNAGKGIAQGNMGQDVIIQFSAMEMNFEKMYIDFK